MTKANNFSKFNIFYYLWSFLPVILACFSAVIVFASANINDVLLIYHRLIEAFFLLVSGATLSVFGIYFFILRGFPFHVICNLVAILFFSAFSYAEIHVLANNFGLGRIRYSFVLWLFFRTNE